MRVVVATITRYERGGEIRAHLAKLTILKAGRLGFPIVIVDGGSPPGLLHEFANLGANVFSSPNLGMGASYRQSLEKAAGLASTLGEDCVYFLTQAEKYSFIRKIPRLVQAMTQTGADLVIPKRRSLASYPPEQAHMERMSNLAFHYLTGQDLDICTGTRLIAPTALNHFQGYAGDYGDRWESIHVPVFRCLAAGLKVVGVPVDYHHPPAQTREEIGNMTFFQKRVDQIANDFSAFCQEAYKLGLTTQAPPQ